MAVRVTVTTWEELVAEIATGGTIGLGADIDMNASAPLGLSSSISVMNSFTIEGNGHQIRNLRTSVTSPVAVFSCRSDGSVSIIINEVDFLNITLDAPLFAQGNQYTTVKLTKCRFTGRRDALFMQYNDSATQECLTISQCFFNFIHATTPNTNSTIVDFIGGGVDRSYQLASVSLSKIKFSDTSSIRIGYNNYKAIRISGCYVYGTVNVYNDNNNAAYIYASGPLTSIFNVYMNRALSQYAWFTLSAQSSSSATSIFYNSSRTSPASISGSNITYVSCTDAEMKSASSLRNKGLDIVVPT